MKYLKIILILLALVGVSGCLWWDWGGHDHDRSGHDREEHHEDHR